MLALKICNVSEFLSAEAIKASYLRIPDWRKEKIASCKLKKTKLLSLAASVALADGMEELGIDLNMPVKISEHGKPEFDYASEPFDGLRVYFNLSHSLNLGACVFSDSPVGLDIQIKKPIRENVAKRYFGSEEVKAIERASEAEGLDLFYRYWTLKESYLKCIGRGIGEDFCSINFSFAEDKNVEFPGFKFIEKDYKEYRICVCEKILV